VCIQFLQIGVSEWHANRRGLLDCCRAPFGRFQPALIGDVVGDIGAEAVIVEVETLAGSSARVRCTASSLSGEAMWNVAARFSVPGYSTLATSVSGATVRPIRRRNAARYRASVFTGAQPPETMWLARPRRTVADTALPPAASGSSTTLAHWPAVIFSAWNVVAASGHFMSSALATSCVQTDGAAPAAVVLQQRARSYFSSDG